MMKVESVRGSTMLFSPEKDGKIQKGMTNISVQVLQKAAKAVSIFHLNNILTPVSSSLE